MNLSPIIIAFAISLLALSAGTWLLLNTQKENVSILYKIVAWFVIVISICLMLSCSMYCAMRCCMIGQTCHEMEMGRDYGMEKWGCMEHMKYRHMMMKGFGDEDDMMDGCKKNQKWHEMKIDSATHSKKK